MAVLYVLAVDAEVIDGRLVVRASTRASGRAARVPVQGQRAPAAPPAPPSRRPRGPPVHRTHGPALLRPPPRRHRHHRHPTPPAEGATHDPHDPSASVATNGQTSARARAGVGRDRPGDHAQGRRRRPRTTSRAPAGTTSTATSHPAGGSAAAPTRSASSGEVDDDDFLALMDGRDPIDGELLGTAPHRPHRARASTSPARPRSRCRCCTPRRRPHPPGGPRRPRRRGRAAAFGWIEDHAHCRYRVNGEIWTVDADGLVAVGVPPAHQPGARPADPHPPGDRQPGHGPRRPVARPRRPHPQARPAHRLGPLRRGAASRADRPPRCPLEARSRTAWPRSPTPPRHVLDGFSQRTEQYEVATATTRSSASSSSSAAYPPRGSAGPSNARPSIDSRPAKTSDDAADLHERLARPGSPTSASRPSDYLAAGHRPDPAARTRRPAIDRDGHRRRRVLAARHAVGVATRRDHPGDRRRPAHPARRSPPPRSSNGPTGSRRRPRTPTWSTSPGRSPTASPLRRDGRPVTEGALDRMLTTQRHPRRGGARPHRRPTLERRRRTRRRRPRRRR